MPKVKPVRLTMLTKAQWDAMTPQAQWDLVQSLAFEVESIEAERFDHPVESIDDEDMTWETAAR